MFACREYLCESSGAQPVRALWQRRDVGSFANGYTVSVPAHGTVLVKVGQPGSTD